MTEVVVTAPARLHFGMLDPAGLGSRRFGGCGVAVEFPRVVVGVRRVGSESSEEVDRARTSGRARRRVRVACPRGVRFSRRRRGRRARGDPAAHRARIGHQARSRDRPGRGRPRGHLGGAESSSRTPPGGESAPAWDRGHLPRRASWSRPACATATRSVRSWCAIRCRSGGGACSRCRSGSRVYPGMLRRGFSACCRRRGPPSSRGCRGWC